MTRLVEYLFSDPGVPTPDAGDNSHMGYGDPGEDGMATRNETPAEYGYGNPFAHLDGQPISFHSRHDIANREHDRTTYDEQEAIRYRGVLSSPWESVDEAKQYRVKDAQGNSHPVEIEHDKEKGDYVAVVRGGRMHKMASGSERQKIRSHATGTTPDAAVKALAKTMRESAGHSVQDPLDEVLKKGKNEPSAGDTRAIKSLTDGKYPAKSEDGKGFCFQWADGRGIVAFKWRNDALRWAKAEPRDIVKFWYGEPVHSNGKFRIRVTDRYRKEEDAGAQTFSELLLERLTL